MTVLVPGFWKVRNIPGLRSFAAGPFPMFFCREIMLRLRPGGESRRSGARARIGRISSSSQRKVTLRLRRNLVWLDLSFEDVVNARGAYTFKERATQH